MNNTGKNTTLVINIVDVLRAWLLKWWLIVILGITGGTIGFCYVSATTVQKYTAYAMMYVNNATLDFGASSVSMSISDINAKRSLVDSYAIILKTHKTLDAVLRKPYPVYDSTGEITKVIVVGKPTYVDSDELNKYLGVTKEYFNYTYAGLYGMISVSSVDETEIFRIRVTCEDSERAIWIANIVADVFPTQVESIMQGTSAKCVDNAVDASAVSRGFSRKVIVGGFVGGLLALAYIFIFYVLLDDTISSIDFIKNTMGDDTPLLAVVPDQNAHSSHRYGYRYYRRYYQDYKSYYKENDDGNSKK